MLKSSSLGEDILDREDVELVNDSMKEFAAFSVLPESEEKNMRGCIVGSWLTEVAEAFFFASGLRPTMRRGTGAVVVIFGAEYRSSASEMDTIGVA